MNPQIKFEVIAQIGNSTLGMRRILKRSTFDELEVAEDYVHKTGARITDNVDVSKLHYAIIKRENVCTTSCVGFFQ